MLPIPANILAKLVARDQTKFAGKEKTTVVTVYDGTKYVDISSHVNEWKLANQTDSSISQIDMTISENGKKFLDINNPFIRIGSKIQIAVTIGGALTMKLGEFYVDEIDYDKGVLDVSGRNIIGIMLKDQNIYRMADYPPDPNERFEISAGVMFKTWVHLDPSRYYIVDPTGHPNWPSSVNSGMKRSDTFVDVIEAVNEFFRNPTDVKENMDLRDSPDGTLYYAPMWYMAKKFPPGLFKFNENDEMFSKSLNINADEVYSELSIQYNNYDYNPDIPDDPIFNNPKVHAKSAIINLPIISVPAEKMFFQTSDEWLTEAEARAQTDKLVEDYHHRGITTDYTCTFRPDLVLGDVAVSVKKGVETTVGIINSITHSFSPKKGFQTAFTANSGGKIQATGQDVMTYLPRSVYGTGRVQNVGDSIKQLIAFKESKF